LTLASGLGTTRNTDVLRPLLALATEDLSPSVRKTAVESIGTVLIQTVLKKTNQLALSDFDEGDTEFTVSQIAKNVLREIREAIDETIA
jgi:hypothetical protein